MKLSKIEKEEETKSLTLIIDDFKTLRIFGLKTKGINSRVAQKGHREELIEFAKNIQKGTGYPIPLWQLIQASEISLSVEQKLMEGE